MMEVSELHSEQDQDRERQSGLRRQFWVCSYEEIVCWAQMRRLAHCVD